MLCYLKTGKLRQCPGLFYVFVVSAESLELFHLRISKLKAKRVFKNGGYSMSLGVVHIWSTSLHLLVQLCLNTCNCSTASLYWSLERNQNKYLDHSLLYLALPDWKLHLLVLLERLTAKRPVCQNCLSRNWTMNLLDSWHSSTINSLSCHLSACQLYFPKFFVCKYWSEQEWLRRQ